MPYTRFTGVEKGTQAEGFDILHVLLDRMADQKRRLSNIHALRERWDSITDLTSPDAFSIMVDWVREQAAYFDATGCVFGVSGGVDSTLVSIVCQKALPGKCRGLILPDAHSSPDDEKDAIRLLDALKVPYKIIPVGAAADALLSAAGTSRSAANPRDVGNMASRLRIATLFYEASSRGEIVVGGGDLDEVYIGYSSKGLAWDLYPINGLHKDEVRAQVHAALEPIDKDLAEKLAGRPATPGFWKGQSAEEQIGMSYTRVGAVVDVIARHCSIHEGGIFPGNVPAFLGELEMKKISGEEFLGVAGMMMKNIDLVNGSPALPRPRAMLAT